MDEREKQLLLGMAESAIQLLLKKDGDRDHMNHSDITCEQSMSIVSVLRALKTALA